jgi:hypothetical protein
LLVSETALVEPAKKTYRRDYSEEEIERGLVEMVLAGGNYRKAASQLAARGFDMPPDTLWAWKRSTHRERYLETRARLLPRIQEQIAEEAEDLAHDYAEVERSTLLAFASKADTLEAKDAAGAVRNLATAKAINIDKAQLLRGQPTQIVERRSGEEILEQLRRRVRREAAVDSSAEEIKA